MRETVSNLDQTADAAQHFAIMTEVRSICVYCGSSPGNSEIYVQSGLQLGRAIATSGLRLVYGGGTRGIMGAVAEGAREANGRVMGIIPRFLMNKEATETALARLDELVVTDNMHQRKHRMFEESDAFVALPGGIGTVEEIVEIMTWGQLGHHKKTMVFANVAGFWSPMIALLDHMRAEGFVHTAHLVQPLVVDRIEDVVPAIVAHAAGQPDGKAAVIGKM